MTHLLLILILCVARWTPSHAATAAASSSLVAWTGRVVFEGDSVAFDWEGVSASVTITSFTSLLVTISDRCAGSPIGGGSRWAVAMTPSDTKVSAAAHRISTFYSSSAVETYVMFSNPSGGCDPYCSATNATTFTLTRITGANPPHPSPLIPHPSNPLLTHFISAFFIIDPPSPFPFRTLDKVTRSTESRLSGCTPAGNLSLLSFSTDGQFLPPPPPKTRKLEFVGDRCVLILRRCSSTQRSHQHHCGGSTRHGWRHCLRQRCLERRRHVLLRQPLVRTCCSRRLRRGLHAHCLGGHFTWRQAMGHDAALPVHIQFQRRRQRVFPLDVRSV
jgi:hypothetical protein